MTIEQGLFKRHFVGRDGFQWWIGQVAPEESWKNNIPGVPVSNNEDESYAGFGERVRVRILGYHTAVKTDIPDDELPWAHVMYPVTAGGGGRGSWSSMNLVGGNFVFGFFLDGEDAQQPIIIGCIGYNDYQAVMKSIPDTSFIPFSGYQQQEPNNEVPPYSVRESGGGVTSQQENATGEPVNDLIVESVQGSNSLQEMSASEMLRRGRVEDPIAKSEDCEPLPTNRIKKEVANVKHDMEYIQQSVYNVRNAISLGSADIQGQLQTLQAKLSRYTSLNTKSILQQTEKKVLKEITQNVKPVLFDLMPNERPEMKEELQVDTEEVACKYTKIFDNTFSMSSDFLGDALGTASSSVTEAVSGALNASGASRFVNVPVDFINDFAGTAIGSITGEIDNLLGDITGSINNVLSSLGGGNLLGSVGKLLGGGSGSGGQAQMVVEDAFSFFKCEEKNKCPTQDSWSTWHGQAIGFSNLLKSAKQVVETAKKTTKTGDAFDQMVLDDIYSEYTSKYGTGAIGEIFTPSPPTLPTSDT